MSLQIDIHALLLEHQEGEHKGAYQCLLAQIEPEFLQCLLAFTQRNKSHAARVAGINISTLERKLTHYGIVVNKVVSQAENHHECD